MTPIQFSPDASLRDTHRLFGQGRPAAQKTEALRALESAAARVNAGTPPYDYIFIDPPYAATADYSRVMQFVASSALLVPDGIVIVEHRKSFSLPESFEPLQRVRLLRQGDAALSFYRRPNLAENQFAGAENP